MRKTLYKKYFGTGHSNNLVFKNGNQYILTNNGVSVLIVNDIEELPIDTDESTKERLLKFIDNFENNFEIAYTFDKLEETEKEYAPIDKEYGIGVKLFETVRKIIKPNKLIQVLENKDKTSYLKYMIKLENTKTNEIGYILPMRTF